jgi:Flp pilus assembly protein TadD
MLTALPLRAITFSLQDKDPANVQVLIHVDVGEAYAAPEEVAVAYAIIDAEGRTAGSQLFSGKLAPGASGLALPLSYVAGAQLPPGDYRLKLAAAIGDKVGSVEHEFHAGLGGLGPLKLSDLTVGGPVPIDEPTAPTVDAVVRFGVVHGYLEVYGPGAPSATVRFEVAETDRSPALLTESVTGRAVGDARAVFSRMVPVGKVPPGWYRLRAVLSSGGETTTLSRAFEVEAAGRFTRTGAAGDAGAPRELFLPVTVTELAPPFAASDALRDAVRQPFAARVPAAVASWWDKGLQALEKSNYQAAETSFKEAIVPDIDTTAALAYLGVTYAASGHDAEAASVWQTALADGRDLPQLYAWLSAAQLRVHAMPAARSTLEEAAGRWPSDPRFSRALALLYASTGRGRDAIQMLERHLSASPDPATLEIALGWIYEAHARGAVVHGAAEDLALARRYANQYAEANGPRQPLVAQWLQALETSLR